MSFGAGFLEGFAGAKDKQNNRQQRERELSIMEAAIKNRPQTEQAVPRDGGTGGGETARPYSGAIGDRVTHAYNRLTGSGIPDHVAAGLVGNLMQESGADINPAAVGDNGNAYGAGQWNGPRMRAYRAYADERGVGYDDFDTQLDWLMHEGQTTEKGAWGQIMQAKTVEDAARIASERFWRPGTPHLENRIGYAQAVYRNRPASQTAVPAKAASAEPAAADPKTFRWFYQYFGGQQ
jgi:hypothetical protein